MPCPEVFFHYTLLVLLFKLFEVSEKISLHGKDFQRPLVSIKIFNTDCLDLHFATKNFLLKSLRAVENKGMQLYLNGIALNEFSECCLSIMEVLSTGGITSAVLSSHYTIKI